MTIVNKDKKSGVAMVSLGCAKNLVNSEQMMFLLKEAGYEVSGDTTRAEIVIVNTCGFIESAKSEAIETIIELGLQKGSGQIKKLVVTGCLAERYKNEIPAELPEVDAIVGVGAFDDIVAVVTQTIQSDGIVKAFGDINAPVSETGRIITTSPVWTYLKIAEGCDNRCAFCVIPDIRGCFRSRPMDRVLDEAKILAKRGTKEFIIVAQDVTRYGLDLYGKRRLPDLLRGLCDIEGPEWIRLHYLYPDEIDDTLISTIAGNDKILKYLDIPIQHINDEILRRMNRRGSGKDIRELFSRLRERIPGLVLRTSVITGLPGEGEREFGELCEFISETKIERAGVFAYSPEEGTPAAAMLRPDEDTALRRAELLSDIQSGVIDTFNESRIGSITKVLIDNRDDGHFYGRSFAESPDVDGYIAVEGSGISADRFYDIVITGVNNGELVGTLRREKGRFEYSQ